MNGECKFVDSYAYVHSCRANSKASIRHKQFHARLSSVNAQNLNTLTNNQDESSHAVCFENDNSIKMSFTDEYIPQIDGDVASPPSKSIMQTEFQCVTCKKAF